MKKFISMAVIFTMAAALFTGCDKKNTGTGDVVDLKLSVASTEVAPGNKLQFTVSSEVAPLSDVVINVSSDKTDVATVPETITLKAGDNSVSEFITGVAVGEATVKISASGDVKISVSEAKITVKEGAVSDPVLSISAAARIEENRTVKYTISSPTAPKSDITINVASSNTANVTVISPVTLKAGETSVQGDMTGVAIGSATISIEAGSTAIATGSVEVSVVEAGPIEYCVADAFCGYSSLEFVKFGDKKIVGGVANPPYFTGNIDITSSTLAYELQYNREGYYGGADYDDDTFTIAIFADWTRTGKFTRVASHNIIDKRSKPTQLVSGTLDIPSDASPEGMFRVIQWFTGDRSESTINANGCGYAESGGIFDISYTIQ